MKAGRRNQRGFTLIEILVSSFLVSIGLFGLAKLQMEAIKSANDGYLFTQAALLGEEMSERMRANPTGAASYVTKLNKQYKAKKNCHSTKCNATQLADQDLEDWIANVTTALPEGEAAVERAPGSTNNYSVVVKWRGFSDGNCDAASSAGSAYWCFRLNLEES
jgi:type IV pilus assembly protein PilV